jgi:predicted branched-subunit amino acid permease
LLASQIPREWGIGFAGTLVLLGLTIPLIINRATLAGVVVASLIAVAAAGLPYRLGLIVAMLAGIAASVSVDRLSTSLPSQGEGEP